MIYLLVGIILNAVLFIVFRSYASFRVDSLQAIVVNYVVCVITGMIFMGRADILLEVDFSKSWSWFGLGLGIMLVTGFYFTSISSQRLGISITSVASKMALVFPVILSLFILKIERSEFHFLNYAGIVLAIISIVMVSVKDNSHASDKRNPLIYILPLMVFASGGMVDMGVNYSNYALIDSSNEDVFPIFIFASAAFNGSLLLLLKRERMKRKNIVGGILLGIPNYFSIYVVFKALSFFSNNGAVFFPIYNIGIILMSALASRIIFKERLSRVNLLGLMTSIIALFLLSYQDIIQYFHTF